jgi:hypothetical protein
MFRAKSICRHGLGVNHQLSRQKDINDHYVCILTAAFALLTADPRLKSVVSIDDTLLTSVRKSGWF